MAPSSVGTDSAEPNLGGIYVSHPEGGVQIDGWGWHQLERRIRPFEIARGEPYGRLEKFRTITSGVRAAARRLVCAGGRLVSLEGVLGRLLPGELLRHERPPLST